MAKLQTVSDCKDGSGRVHISQQLLLYLASALPVVHKAQPAALLKGSDFLQCLWKKSNSQFWHKTVHSLSIYNDRNLKNLRLQDFLGSSVIQVPHLRYPKDGLASQTQEKKVRAF